MSGITKFDAVVSLIGENGSVSCMDGNDISTFYYQECEAPKSTDIDAKQLELQAEWNAKQYARKRAQEYPDLAEQLDLLWHAIDAGTLDDRDYRNKFYSMLKKVKTDNPKG